MPGESRALPGVPTNQSHDEAVYTSRGHSLTAMPTVRLATIPVLFICYRLLCDALVLLDKTPRHHCATHPTPQFAGCCQWRAAQTCSHDIICHSFGQILSRMNLWAVSCRPQCVQQDHHTAQEARRLPGATVCHRPQRRRHGQASGALSALSIAVVLCT